MPNTDNLIAALPEWYRYGLRAITVGFQGGWPVHCVDVTEIDNNPFGIDGLHLDEAYADRMDRIIRATDELGMVCIVSMLYWAQTNRFEHRSAVTNAIQTGCRFLKDQGYTNVIIEVANEYNIQPFETHPIVHSPEGMVSLIRLARESSGGMLTGASGGIRLDPIVAEESDIFLIHCNGLTQGGCYTHMNNAHEIAGDKPVLCNEDSPCYSHLDAGLETYTSWGYYNNYTKQIPPADFGITPGEDLFFARRIARATGIPVKDLPIEEQFHLQGLEPWESFHGKQIIRLASEFPESVAFVDFYLNGKKFCRSYEEPFFLQPENTWMCTPRERQSEDREWKAVVTLYNGQRVEKTQII